MKSVSRERSMLFVGPLVLAIRAGRKTETRRLIVPQPPVSNRMPERVPKQSQDLARHLKDALQTVLNERGQTDPRLLLTAAQPSLQSTPAEPSRESSMLPLPAPPFAHGDQIWVRETWGYAEQFLDRGAAASGPIVYAADGVPTGARHRPWKPSLHMPRRACRLVLNVKECIPQRLQQMTVADARAEGCPSDVRDPIGWFIQLWNALRRERGLMWNDDPWVWVIRFSPGPSPIEAPSSEKLIAGVGSGLPDSPL